MSLSRAWLPRIVAVLGTVVILGPVLLVPGYTLIADMIFTPTQPWKDAWVGADGRVPRAVPSDAVVSLLTQVIDGAVLQKAILGSLLVAAGVGAARLFNEAWLRSRTTAKGFSAPPAGLVAATLMAMWNPWVYQRLAMGQWALLVGYAALFWVFVGLLSRRGDVVVLAVGFAALASPTGGAFTAAAAITGAALISRRWVIWVGLSAAVLNAPWVAAGFLGASSPTSTAASSRSGVEAFAASADTDFGVVGSLLTLGGGWKTSIEVPGREHLPVMLVALAVTLAALWSLVRWMGGGRPRALPTLIVAAAVVSVLVAWLPSTTVGAAAAGWMVQHLPGAALLRDSQKITMFLVVAVVVGWALTVARQPAARAAMLSVTPVLLLPGLAWGQLGRLEPVQYPDDWQTVDAILRAEAGSTDISVALPFTVYRRWEFNGSRAVLDPAPRYFPTSVITEDTLQVEQTTVPGDDPKAGLVRKALDGPEPDTKLAALGISWAIVAQKTPGEVPDLTGWTLRHSGPDLQLFAAPAVETNPASAARLAPSLRSVSPAGTRLLLYLVNVAAALWLVGCCVKWLTLTRRSMLGPHSLTREVTT